MTNKRARWAARRGTERATSGSRGRVSIATRSPSCVGAYRAASSDRSSNARSSIASPLDPAWTVTASGGPRLTKTSCLSIHARRHSPDKQDAGMQRGRRLPPAPKTATAASVTRKVDSSGNVRFAGTNYRVGSKYRRRQVHVAVVGDTVEISIGNELIRSHCGKHDRTREHGALANPGGRPHRVNAA
jgi:Mu transposase, C-terminal domain